ncbi:MAG TPA: antitoxin MazE-like protein [Pararhizobium sp.]|nr:antitoxin MazE-like protein [Pararhizobium sp.]
MNERRESPILGFREQEALMGRPRELTEEERTDLLAKGYKPVEVWVPDWSSLEFKRELERMCEDIRESDRRLHMNEVLEAFIEDVWDDLD